MKKLLFTILFLLIALPVSVAQGAYYVNNPTSCLSLDPATYPGQDCTPQNICGVVSGIVQCLDNSTLNPPTASSTSNTLYSASFGGGFIMDCYRATTCNYGYCNRSSTCYTTKRRDTTCVPNVWETATCGNCRSGYLDCAGDDVCEVQIGSTAWSTPNTTYLTCSTGQCASGYQACEGETATADGCNYQTGVTSCTTGGGEPGTIGASCTCVALPQENFITNTLASAWGSFLLYAEQLNPTGWLINLYNDVTGAFFRVDHNGNASTTGSMTANSYCINTSSPDCITAWPATGDNLYWLDDGTNLTPVTSTRNVSTTGYISGGLNSVFGSATEYLTVSSRDLVGGGLFVAPLLKFTNSNVIGQSTKIGAIDNGLYLSDADAGQPTIGFFSGTAIEPYGLLEYSTSTQTMRLNTYQNDATQEYLDINKIDIGGDFYPLITGVADDGNAKGFASKDSFIISGNNPILGFYDEDDNAYNIMQMSADGLLSLGGISAVSGAISTESGLKEVVNIGGAFFVPSPATKTCSVYQDSYNTSGFARTARMGAVCGIRNETGDDDWIGGISIEAFSTSTGSSTPVMVANFKPSEIIFTQPLTVSTTATSTFNGGLEIDGTTTLNNVTTSCGTLGTDENGAIVCNDLGGMFGSTNDLEARIAELEKKLADQQSLIKRIINFLKLWIKL